MHLPQTLPAARWEAADAQLLRTALRRGSSTYRRHPQRRSEWCAGFGVHRCISCAWCTGVRLRKGVQPAIPQHGVAGGHTARERTQHTAGHMRAYAAHGGAGADLDDGCKVGLDVRLPLVEALPTLDDDEWREAPALVRADGSLQRSSTVAGCDGGLRCDARGRFSIETQPCVGCTWRCCGVHARSDDVVEQSRRIRHWRPWHQMGAHALWG